MDAPDVTLIVQNMTFPCNREVLSRSSPYFEAMFANNFVESQLESINIHDVKPEIFQYLINYACTKAFNLPNTLDHLEILRAARIFQFEDLCECLLSHFFYILDITNCIYYWQTADYLGLEHLYKNAKRVALWNLYWHYKPQCHGIETLSYNLFEQLITDPRLRVKNELDVLDSLYHWMAFNVSVDQEIILKLMHSVRFEKCDRLELIDIRNTVFKNHPAIYEELNFVLNKPIECDLLSANLCKSPKRPRKLPFVPILVEINQEEPAQRVLLHTCHCTTDGFILQKIASFSVNQLQSEPVCLVGFGISIPDKDVYIFGGKEQIASGSWNEELWKYDTFKETWQSLSPVPKKIRHFLYTADTESIYIMGGFGMYRIAYGSVLRYAIADDSWTELPDAPGPIFSAAISVYKGSLYLFSDYVYKLSDGEGWVRLTMTPALDKATQAITVGNYIYLLAPNTSSMVVYDPATNSVIKSVSFEGVHWQHACIVDNEIWLFWDGGVEIFHLEGWTKRVWTRLKEDVTIEYVSVIPVYD